TAAIEEIAEASKHQVEIIEGLNSGIEQISKVVQNNTATAEEGASASQELSAQAALLNEMISKYRVD
ncbi:MAG: methyl-accepting chemotaxis protein, partial [Oscillospiraceae bacterium]